MFIKKDTRKIPDILNDENDDREELHLGRRYATCQIDLHGAACKEWGVVHDHSLHKRGNEVEFEIKIESVNNPLKRTVIARVRRFVPDRRD